MITYFKIQNSTGVSDNNDGTYTVHFAGSSRLATAEEIAVAQLLQRAEQINTIRAQKEQLPISYDGKTLDADEQATKNINGKILELESKNALGITIDTNTLFWRDSDNTTHVWTDAATYLAWLRGLAIAIAERTSMLYYIAWTKKADNSDIEAGW